MKTIVLGLIFCSLAFSISAQNIMYNVRLDHYFDNREYDTPYTEPQTLFGIRVSPEIGWKYVDPDASIHKIMGGVHYLQPIGTQIDQAQYDPPTILRSPGSLGGSQKIRRYHQSRCRSGGQAASGRAHPGCA